jgi:DNA-binding HxlR family transcriptional regulator
MERTGIVERSIYPIVPPKVEYKLTKIGVELLKLSREFATWFDNHHENIHKAKRIYDKQR